MSTTPVLTGDPRTDRALLALARLVAEVAQNPKRPAVKPDESQKD